MVRTEEPLTLPKESRPVQLTWAGIAMGVRRIAPVSVFVVPFGIAFGAAAVDQGMIPVQSMVMSATVFAGASQFAALEMWQTPLPYLSLALVVLAVNARHIILGAALSPWINQLPRGRRLIAVLLMSDVNFADSHAALKAGANDLGVLVGGGMVMWVTWVFGTAIGAYAGASLGDLDRFGIDVVMASFFIALVVGELKSPAKVLPPVVGAAVAMLTVGFLPTGWNIIAGALAGGAAGTVVYAR